jgi:MoaA/NifB/PqqE/SkfB family radical SAM enzyme
MFCEILRKIRLDLPADRVSISLYNWGEPLLHPDLPKFVAIARNRGFFVAVSTNLSMRRDLEALVRAAPDVLRISLSGYFQATYERTHRGGRIDLVIENLRRLRSIINVSTHGPTDVHLAYHWYRHNVGEDLARIEALAAELDFRVIHKVARIYPLEVLLAGLENGWGPATSTLYEILLITPEEWRDEVLLHGRQRWEDCLMRRNEMAVNVDGSVHLCCITFDAANRIASNYLDVSINELQARKYSHPTCARCSEHGIYQSHSLDDAPRIRDLIESRQRAIASMRPGA